MNFQLIQIVNCFKYLYLTLSLQYNCNYSMDPTGKMTNVITFI